MCPPPAGWVSVLRIQEAALLSAQADSMTGLPRFTDSCRDECEKDVCALSGNLDLQSLTIYIAWLQFRLWGWLALSQGPVLQKSLWTLPKIKTQSHLSRIVTLNTFIFPILAVHGPPHSLAPHDEAQPPERPRITSLGAMFVVDNLRVKIEDPNDAPPRESFPQEDPRGTRPREKFLLGDPSGRRPEGDVAGPGPADWKVPSSGQKLQVGIRMRKLDPEKPNACGSFDFQVAP